MKKNFSKRILSGLMAVVMVFLMIPISIVSVSAADTTKTMTPLQEYRANTTKSLEQITSYINKREAEDLALKNSFGNNIKKINTFSKGIGTAINTALMIYNTIDEDASWGENLGNIALNLVCSYIGVQLPGQESEAEVIIKEIEKMLDEVNSRIDAVNENIDALSEQVDQNTANLASYMWSLNQFDNDIDVLNEFTQASNTGAYSYYTDREKLYASYNELMLLLDSGTATSSAIKSAYDKLYIEAIKSEQLYQYMTGENNKLTNGKSIQEALYEYSVLSIYLCSKGEVTDENGNLENIEIKCVEFAEDLYSTYMFSNYALMLCYNYQIDYLNSHSNDALTTYYDVEGIEGVNNILGASIFGHENLVGKVPSMLEKQEIINIEIASYIAYVLNLEGSYLYETGAKYEDGSKVEESVVYTIPYKELFLKKSHNTEDYQITYGSLEPVTKHVRTNNRVAIGDTLYMNVLPNDLASLFASGEFTFTTSDENLATVNNAGVVNIVGTSGSFVISMKYNNTIIYSLEFTIEDRLYSGGMGIEDCPYFISTWNDITTLAGSSNHYQAENIYFETTRDIDCDGATFAGIPSFKGTWNGNEYRVYNFKIDTSGINNTGFFRVVESSATIKNVILGHYDKSYSTYDNYSVYVNGYLDCDGVFYVGGLCGANYGTISNCSLEAVKVCGKIYWAGDNDISNVVGGIAGRNEKDIDNCKVSKSFFYSNATAKKDGDASLCHAYTGGIVGKNIGVLKDSISYSNHMAGYTYSKQDWGDAPGAYTYCGAMMGWMTQSGTADNCYEQQNTFDPVADADDSSNDDTATGGISGYRDMTFSGSIFDMNIVYLGTVTNCGENSLGSWTISSATGCPTKLVLIQDSDPIVGGGTYADVLEYVRGDKCLKYTYTTGGNPAYATTTTYEYELSIGRIDTSKAGTQPAVKLTTISGTTQYHKETLTITVVPEEIKKLEIYTAPSKQIYAVNSESLDLSGLRLVVLYNNGSTRFLNNGNEEGLPKDFTEAYDFTALGETQITFKYEEHDVSLPVTVVYCTHSNTENKVKIEPTCGSVGYKAGLYCNDCQAYLEGGSQIPMTGDHIYAEWINYDNDKHSHRCSCGKIEYATHNWNDGTITKPATHLVTGELTKTCSGCSATKKEEIGPITEHAYGSWTKYNDTQHVRSCACGEKEYGAHSWNAGVITKQPTHLAYGERTYTCNDCSATKKEEIGPIITDHSYGSWTKYNDTQHVRSCACGEKEYATHSWNAEVITKQPTHLATGERTYTCNDCGETKKEAIDPIAEHSFSEWLNCDEKQHNSVCACGKVKYEAHRWGDGVINNNVITKTCLDCGAIDTESLTDPAYITVDSKTAFAGQTLSVNISLRDNPGITSMRINVSYDSSLLTLTEVKYNSAMGGQSVLPENIQVVDGSLILYWTDGFADYKKDGLFATLTFRVSDDVENDVSTNISVTYDSEDVYNSDENNVRFVCESGVIPIINYVPGDINGDGVVNSRDTTRLMRYLAGWSVEVNESALDVNGDGAVNSKDTTRLMRYLAGWNVEIC